MRVRVWAAGGGLAVAVLLGFLMAAAAVPLSLPAPATTH